MFANDNTAPDPAEQTRSASLFHFFYVFFRPERFFETFALSSRPFLVGGLVWLIGISTVVSWLDRVVMQISDDQPIATSCLFLLSRWDTFWTWSAVLGVSAGTAVYVLRGLWYRIRIGFCEVRPVNPYLARRVFVYAFSVAALPHLVITVLETALYDSPREAWSCFDTVHLLILLVYPLFAFGSVYVAYRGARACFGASPLVARFWFLALPAGAYVLSYVLLLVTGVVSALLATLNEIQTVDRPLFSLQCPAIWNVTSSKETEVRIEPDDGNYAFVSIRILDQEIEPSTYIPSYMKNMTDLQAQRAQKTIVKQLGRYAGYGYAYPYTEGELECIETVFAGRSGKRSFVICSAIDRNALAELEPGIRLIYESFLLKE